MPWTDEQALLLRELGVHWARGGGVAPAVSTVAAPAPPDRAPEPAQAPPQVPPQDRVQAGMPAGTQTPVQAGMHARAQEPGPPTPPAPASAPVVVSARLDPSMLDWDALRAAVASCEACSLSRTRTKTVFGVGSRQAHWLIVGEAPGEQEDLRGEPFVGAAGQLLDRMLAALGLRRGDGESEEGVGMGEAGSGADRVYIANTLKCRPPGNRNPQPEELTCCEPFLQRQIALLQPRIILAMGRFAVQSLLRSAEPVGKLRGRVHRYQGVPLVVTYHPAYLLRNPADKAKAWADLCLAASTCGGAAVQAR